MPTASLDWSQCPAVESVPGRVSGAWVLRDARMPVSVIFENLEYGATLEEIVENYGITREQIQAVFEFAALSTAPPPDSEGRGKLPDSRVQRRPVSCVTDAPPGVSVSLKAGAIP